MYFNPRTPGRVRRLLLRRMKSIRTISIHAPRVGCDSSNKGFNRFVVPISIHAPRVGCDRTIPCMTRDLRISIHAPRVGCDEVICIYVDCNYNFNPRTPGRVRLSSMADSVGTMYFNPRTPGRVRPFYFPIYAPQIVISIHAPRVGCDTSTHTFIAYQFNFNPRTPGRVRPSSGGGIGIAGIYFNPRTPGRVRLRISKSTTTKIREFQSTHPG